MRSIIFSLTVLKRKNQELQNAFLDESLAQKEAEIQFFKVGTLFAIFAHSQSYRKRNLILVLLLQNENEFALEQNHEPMYVRALTYVSIANQHGPK